MSTERFLGIRYSDFVQMMGVTLTPVQGMIARVAFDGDSPEYVRSGAEDEFMRVFGDLPNTPIDEDVRSVVVAVCGARGGKSYALIALRILHLALSVDVSHLAVGEQASGIIVAPDVRLGRQTLRYVKGLVDSKLSDMLLEESADQVILDVRGRRIAIEVLPASAGGRAVRGRSLVGAAMDEAAFFRDQDNVVNDADVYAALAPRIVPGGQLIIASTPWAESGLLYDLFEANLGKPTTALAIHAPTTLLRPDKKTASMVAREKKRDPENWAREFQALFMSTSGSQFFDTRTVDAAFERWVRERPVAGYPMLATVVGADLGFTSDHSAWTSVGEETPPKQLLAPQDHPSKRLRLQDHEVMRPEKGKPLKPSDVMNRLVAFTKSQHAEQVWADIHYQELVREHVSNAGLSFAEAPAGAEGKLDQYSKVRAMFAEGVPSLPPIDGLREQMLGVTKKPLPGGGMQISQKRSKTGGHSDLASALVLALWAAQVSGTGRIVPDGKLPGWRDSDLDDSGDLDFEDHDVGATGSAYDL